MRAKNRGVLDRPRAVAVLLTCLLGLTLLTAGRSGPVHKQLAHRVAVVAAASPDAAQFLHRTDQPVGLPQATAETAGIAGSFSFTDSSRAVSSRTADAPRVRGPPGEPLA